MFIHAFYDQVVFVYILPTFRENFYILAKWVEILTKICYNPGHTTWQFVFLPVKSIRATGRRKACYFHANYNAKLFDIFCQTT